MGTSPNSGVTDYWEDLLHRITVVETEERGLDESILEFARLLRGDRGGEVLRWYVQSYPKCSQLLDAWKARQGGQLLCNAFKLITEIFKRDEGMDEPMICKNLDKFARLLVRKYLPDIYIQLDGSEFWFQITALSLITSIIRRGPRLAYKVSTHFDFHHPAFVKLAGTSWVRTTNNTEVLLRQAYVKFAMSFIEVGDSDLLSCVLQQKKMYSGVLSWLSCDFDDTVTYVLSILRDKILIEKAFVPPSSLFRSVALDQLAFLSAVGGQNAELAYNSLVLACTDPCNGLMPNVEMGLRGKIGRMIKFMKSLDPITVQCHKDLLLVIVNCRPSFGLSYLEGFPYNIEKFKSFSWLGAVCLATNLVCLIKDDIYNQSLKQSSDGLDVQEVMKCMFLSLFSSSQINKGLLHKCILAKHATLKLLLELHMLLDIILIWDMHKLDCRPSTPNKLILHAKSIKQELHDNIDEYLPALSDLLPVQCSSHSCVKIVGVGNHITYRGITKSEAESDEDLVRYLIVGEIWGMEMSSMMIASSNEVKDYLQSQVYKALNYLHG